MADWTFNFIDLIFLSNLSLFLCILFNTASDFRVIFLFRYLSMYLFHILEEGSFLLLITLVPANMHAGKRALVDCNRILCFYWCLMSVLVEPVGLTEILRTLRRMTFVHRLYLGGALFNDACTVETNLRNSSWGHVRGVTILSNVSTTAPIRQWIYLTRQNGPHGAIVSQGRIISFLIEVSHKSGT